MFTIFQFFSVVFELVIDEILINFPVITISQQFYSFVFNEVTDVVACTVPLFLVDCLQNYSWLIVGDEDGVSELFLLHSFE